jgi:hypothetical protein
MTESQFIAQDKIVTRKKTNVRLCFALTRHAVRRIRVSSSGRVHGLKMSRQDFSIEVSVQIDFGSFPNL